MSRTPLERALSALRDGSEEDARAFLAQAWRERRSPRLAALAALLELRSPSALGRRIREIVAPRVAITLDRVNELADVDDPLLATFVLDALESPPFTGPSARPLLETLVDTAARLADPRLVDRVDAIARVWELRVTPKPARVALTKRLRASANAIAAPPPATLEEGVHEAALAEIFGAVASGARTTTDLFADVYASPAEDAPRLVLADHLLERGDPRGELIMLQFARKSGTLDERGAAREYALLKKHGKEWLGPLAPVISWGKGYAQSRFDRGFLAIADIILSVGKKMDLVFEEESWATVEELRGSWPLELLERAPLRGLRTIERELTSDTLERLVAKGVVLPNVEAVGMFLPNAAAGAGSLAKIFPALRVLDVYGHTPATLADVTELLRLDLPLRRLVVDRPWSGGLEDAERLMPGIEAEFDQLIAAIGTLAPTFSELALQPPWRVAPKPPPVELRIVDGRYERLDDAPGASL
jgi:uncharacterized protein (TIGR02996 family)